MKTKKSFSLILLVFGLTSILEAQYCNFFAMSEGMVLTYEDLDSKGKITSYTKTTCHDLVTDSTGAIIYKVKIEASDPNENFISSREYEMICDDGKLLIDVESYADPNALKKFQDMAIDIDTKDMSYPKALFVGQALPDAEITITTVSRFNNAHNYKLGISKRKVISQESVTVPAGTYECYKITYDMKFKSPIKKKYRVCEYISEGVGRVKTETYTKKGKLQSASVLVEYVK